MNGKHGQSGIIAFALLLLLILFVPVGCGEVPPVDPTGTLEGTVLFWEGDFFPGSPTGTKTPVVREVLVYEAATYDQVTQEPFNYSFFSAIHTHLVATTMSDSNGRFSLDLPEGTYSLFVRENGQYYANLMTDEFINPVDVVSGATTTFTFDISYMMTW
ncbi:MAG: peptidase associated/transthyretin-like domain-containing protein [Nitrospirota bacterium]